MGNLCVAKIDVYFVEDEVKSNENKGIGFSKKMFKKKEWSILKKFCNKRNIKQVDLNAIYKKYLSSEDVFIREFRVKIVDIKLPFLKQSKLMQELCDCYIPELFLKKYHGLMEPFSPDEVSFARFCILGYIFILQAIPDLFLDFLAFLRKRLTVKVSAPMFTFNFQQLIKQLAEETKPSFSLDYVINYSNLQNDDEITIESIIKIALRYPLLFYPLVRFRKHFRRVLFGDKFWEKLSLVKSHIDELEDFDYKFFYNGFENEKEALKMTARSILADISDMKVEGDKKPVIRLSDNYREPLTSLTEECCIRCKDLLGYEIARNIIRESELTCPESQCFVEIPISGDTDLRFHCNAEGRDFIFNTATGITAWVHTVEKDGSVVKEHSIRIAPPHPVFSH